MKQEQKSGLHYIKEIKLEIYYQEKMTLIWYIIKTFTFEVNNT